MRTTRTSIVTTVVTAIALCTGSPPTQQAPELFTVARGEHLPVVDTDWLIRAGDLDGDGDADLVLGRNGALLINDGRAVFRQAPAGHWSAPPKPWALLVFDPDGDGDLDLLVGDGSTSWLFANDGTGRFTDVSSAKLPAPPAVTTAIDVDVDGDGDRDVVLVDAVLGLQMLLNDGTGTLRLAPASHMPQQPPAAWRVAALDLDGDGDMDLLTTNPPLLHENDGTGRFTTRGWLSTQSQVETVTTADFDGDGLDDVYLGVRDTRGYLFLNRGQLQFVDVSASWLPPTTVSSGGSAAWDQDGDGDVDLVIGGDGPNRLLRNEGRQRFVEATGAMPARVLGTTYDVIAEDFDGDLVRDVLLVNGTQPPDLLLAAGAGFVAATALAIPLYDQYTVSTSADFDADGDLDLLLAFMYRVDLVPNDGIGRFGNERTVVDLTPIFGIAVGAAAGDVDGDGDVDAIIGASGIISPTPNVMLLNDGSGRFSARIEPFSRSTRHVRLVDLDADGDLDLLEGTVGGLALYANDGRGTFTDVTAARLPPTRTVAGTAVGDLDGDGDLDIAAGGFTLEVYLNDGTGTFSLVSTSLSTALSNAIDLGDVDGDGDLDMLVGGGTSQTAPVPFRLFLNDGRAGFIELQNQTFPGQAATTLGLAFVDADGDGDLDVYRENNINVFANPTFLRQLLRNDGGLTFSDISAGLPRRRYPSAGITAGDFDGDGDTDFVGYGLVPELLSSTRRHLHVPLLARPGGSVRLEVESRRAMPGALVLSWFAPRLAARPLTLQALGRLALDPTGLVLGPVGSLDPTGHLIVDLAVPANSRLAGVELFLQAIVLEGALLADARLTGAASVRIY